MSLQTKKRKFLFFKLRRHHYIALLLIIIVLAVFARSFRYEFLNYDDGVNIYENPYVKQFNLLHFLKKHHLGLYIPLTYSLWAFQAKLAKISPAEGTEIELNPHVFHTTNIIVHLLSMLVVFIILRNLTRNDWAAFAGALLFGLHPVQVEPVVWITGFKNVLSGFLSLVAVWQYLSYAALSSAQSTDKGSLGTGRIRKRSIAKRRRLHYITATISFVLAILAMPIAIVVPLVAGILSYWILRRSSRQCVVELIPWVVLALPIIILTKLSQPDVTIESIATFWQRPLIAGDALMFYIYKLAWPISLAPDYGRSPKFVVEHGWIYFTGMIPYLTAIVLAWKYRRPWLLASSGVFVAGVLPVLGFVPFVFQDLSTVADRYLYIAMLGPALALAWFLSAHTSMLMRIICVLIIGMLGLRSAHQTQYWRNSSTIFKHALEVNSDSWLAKNNLGFLLEKQGKLEEAIAHYNEALRLKPNFVEAHNNLGNVFQQQGKLEEAIAQYAKALRTDPNFAETHSNIGTVLQKQGKFEEAIAHYTEAIKLDPNYTEAHYNLGNIFQQQGALEEAIVYYTKAIKLDPNYTEAHNNLGTVLQKQGKLEEAIAHYNEALRLKPNFAGVHNNLGNIFQQQGKLEEATAHYAKALRIDPNFVEAHYNMGIAIKKQGKLEEAAAHFTEVLRLKPNFPEVHNILGNIFQQQGKLEEATAHYIKALRLKPDFPEALNNLGNIFQQQGKLEEAIAQYAKALRIDPNFPEAHNNLGFVLQKQGKLEEAISHYNEALRIKPDLEQARRNLSKALQEKRRSKY